MLDVGLRLPQTKKVAERQAKAPQQADVQKTTPINVVTEALLRHFASPVSDATRGATLRPTVLFRNAGTANNAAV
jgi:predicted nucleic acid-binding Zn ribbon protein